MCCNFGIIYGHVVQLKELCSPIEGTGPTIGPIWAKKINELLFSVCCFTPM